MAQPFLGAQNRLDFSGIRGGVKRPLTKRDGEFPYDKPMGYGTPARGKPTSNGKDAGSHPIVPKDVSHSAWEELGDDIDQNEASGTPINFGKSGNAQSSGVVPGGPNGWSKWSDDQEMPDDELTRAAKQNAKPYQNRMPAGGRQYVAGAQKRTMNGRENKMSAWQKIHEAFVSLRSTPEGEMTMSQGVEQAELESVMQEYEEQSQKAASHLDELDEIEGLKFLFQLDPDHAATSLADVGKDRIRDTYKTWADRAVMQQPNDQEIDDDNAP